MSWWYLHSELLLYRKERPTISFHQLKMIMNIVRVFKNMNTNVTIYDYKLCQAWLIQRGEENLLYSHLMPSPAKHCSFSFRFHPFFPVSYRNLTAIVRGSHSNFYLHLIVDCYLLPNTRFKNALSRHR